MSLASPMSERILSISHLHNLFIANICNWMPISLLPDVLSQYIPERGLMACYDDGTDTRESLRSFMALALLPIDRIRDGYDLLREKSHASNR